MQTNTDRRGARQWARAGMTLCLTVVLPLLLSRCSPSGDSGGFSPPSENPGPQLEQQAIANLVQLYREAVVQEDIDRVQSLLAPEASTPTFQADPLAAPHQTDDGTFATLRAFREHLSATFRTRTVTALHTPEEQIQIASDRHSVTFLEIESTIDPTRRVHQTRVYRTTFALRRTETAPVVRFRIGAVTRQGPLVQISTPGQVREVCGYCDGAIVGSAIVRRIAQGVAHQLPHDALVDSVSDFISQLLSGGADPSDP